MQALLLFIFVLDSSELSELDHLGVNLAGYCNLTELLFKYLHQSETTLFTHLDRVLLLHECDILKFIWCHYEADTLTCTGDTCCTTDTVDILFNLTREIPLKDPIDALEVETTRRNISANQQTSAFVLSFIKAEEVDLTITVVHVSVKLEYHAIVQGL